MSEIRYARICKLEGKEISWDQIVKGYPKRRKPLQKSWKWL